MKQGRAGRFESQISQIGTDFPEGVCGTLTGKGHVLRFAGKGLLSISWMKEWFYFASRPRVVRRSLKFGVIVGTILIVINHGSALVEGDFSAERLLRMALTVMVPYFVSTSSSVCAMKEQAREKETGDA